MINLENSENPTYPISGSLLDKCGEVNFNPLGITKREYFAGLAMQGLLGNHEQIGGTTNFEWLATHAVGYADELLKELSKTK